MSKMQELFEKVSKDNALQEKFSAIMKDAEKAGKEETEAKLTAFAKEVGYVVSVEEMQTFFKELAEKGKDELSDSELDMVAGGKTQGWVAFSIGTVGIGCALGSIIGSSKGTSCEKEVNDQLNMQM